MISKIEFSNYKKFKKFNCEFSNSLPNIISGENAAGKTAIISAIFLLLTGKNLYGKKISLSIKKDESFFELKGVIDDQINNYYRDENGTDVSYDIKETREKAAVLFADSKLVYEFQNLPSKRMRILRSFIHSNDDSLRESFKEIEELKAQISSVIDSRQDKETKKRISQNLFRDISVLQNQYYQREKYLYQSFYKEIRKNRFFNELELTFKIKSEINFETSKEIFDSYKKNIDRVLDGRERLITINNDSLVIETNGKPINDYLSKGQLRILLTMIINSVISLDYFSQKNKYLLLDDYFSELSENSIILLINTLKKDKAQIFITNPSKDLNFLKNISYNIII